METKIFDKNEEIKLHDRQFIFLSDGTKALHLYKEDLKREFPSIKTWEDLIKSFTPLIIEFYNTDFGCKIIIK